MTKKELKQKIKEEQKCLAENIKRGKFLKKPRNWSSMTPDENKKYIYIYSDYGRNCSEFKNYLVDELRETYRHNHIMYCSFFNNK